MHGYKKDTVEETRSFDILDLQRLGFFKRPQGYHCSSKWTRGEEIVASIGYSLENGENGSVLQFRYIITDADGEKTEYDYPVNLDWTPCHFGGCRWWFICPLSLKGKQCKRRCRILYFPPGAKYFGCRECYNLTYESRQMHRNSVYEGLIKPYMEMEKRNRKKKNVTFDY